MKKDLGSALSATNVVVGEGKPMNNINNNNNINEFISEYTKESKKKKFIGIHFEEDVASILQTISKQSKKGTQSEIVNDAVRKLLQERGLM